MLTWVVIALIVAAGLWFRIEQTGRRQKALRERVEGLLRQLGVPFVSVGSSSNYGWPLYTIVFGSFAEKEAFATSRHFERLLAELVAMHGTERRGGNAFEPRMALELQPHGPVVR